MHFKHDSVISSPSTIKMLYWMCKEAELTLTWHHIEHAVKRNFGGFDEFDPLLAFSRKVIMPRGVELSQYSKQVCDQYIVTM